MDIPGVSHGGPTDTPKKKKHREELIVIGTLVLVVLTFMMVARKGTNAPTGEPTTGAASDPTADGVGGVAGGGGGSDPYSYLPAALAALPGQVEALTFGAQLPQLKSARKRVRTQRGTIAKLRKRNRQESHKIKGLENQIHHLQHPKKPPHPIVVHHKTAPHRAHSTHYGTHSPPIRRT